MTNACIKTGAKVWLDEYDCLIAADIYAVGDCRVIRANLECIENGARDPEAAQRATHRLTCNPVEGFWRGDIGVFVVPQAQLVTVAQ